MSLENSQILLASYARTMKQSSCPIAGNVVTKGTKTGENMDRDNAGYHNPYDDDLYVIDSPRYGERTGFNSLEEAEDAIRECGEEFESVSLFMRGSRIVNENGETVGERI